MLSLPHLGVRRPPLIPVLNTCCFWFREDMCCDSDHGQVASTLQPGASSKLKPRPLPRTRPRSSSNKPRATSHHSSSSAAMDDPESRRSAEEHPGSQARCLLGPHQSHLQLVPHLFLALPQGTSLSSMKPGLDKWQVRP